MIFECVDYPTETPPLIFRIETPPPIFSSNINFPAMNNTMKNVLGVVLVVAMFYSSMMLYIFNSTSLATEVCSDCVPMNTEELKLYYLCRCVLIIASIALTIMYISNEIINPKTDSKDESSNQ